MSLGLFLLMPILTHGQEPSPGADTAARAQMPGTELPAAVAESAEDLSKAHTGDAAEEGQASWYGRRFAGRRTACGMRFDPNQRTLAHPSLPCGTHVRITNLSNGRSVEAEVADRGPFTGGRIADLSRAAARALHVGGRGTVRVRIEVIVPAGEGSE